MMAHLNSSVIIVAAISLAALCTTGVIFFKQRKKHKTQSSLQKIPSKWKKIGEVGELILYPLKGAKRKCINEAQCTTRGLRELSDSTKLALQDRVFVVFDDKAQFMNLKKNSKLLFIGTVSVDIDKVKFTYPNASDLIVKIPDRNNNTSLSKLDFYYGEKVATVDCGDEAAEWFSQQLLNKSTGLRLGCFVESLIPPRTIDGAYVKQVKAYPKFDSNYLGSYSDIASYMLMSEESLNDLNSRLKKPVTEHNFRPNIMVKGSSAFSEDSWDWVKIGQETVFRSFKYCTRCIVTSIDPDTAKSDPSFEPLKTLRTYRQVKEPQIKEVEGSSPVMGLYVGCHIQGTIQVGDPVYINAE